MPDVVRYTEHSSLAMNWWANSGAQAAAARELGWWVLVMVLIVAVVLWRER